jgi:hypothetical protein
MSLNHCEIDPVTIRRASGNWLAVSPKDATLRIGATGSTESEAIDNFKAAVCRWCEPALENSVHDLQWRCGM